MPAEHSRAANAGGAYIWLTSLSAALGGFLMGFDASVISGVVGFIEDEFRLNELQLGWAVASLTLTSTLAMLGAGPLSNRIGRVGVLRAAALLFLFSAFGCAVAPGYSWLVLARMVGGFAVGAALIVAPMYIAEVAPAAIRGRLVSLNQLNIVIGISAAFFSNYLLLQWSGSDFPLIRPEHLWRWMLGVESLPALLYLIALQWVPESPRWLQLRGRDDEALDILVRINGADSGKREHEAIQASLAAEEAGAPAGFAELLRPHLRLVLLIALTIGIVQQATGINAVFFYAPMIFEQSGFGNDAAFLQAVLVGLVNLLFTIVAILCIDRLGRKPLLFTGLAGIAVFMLLLSWTFNQATYQLSEDSIAAVADVEIRSALEPLGDQRFDSENELREALGDAGIGDEGGLESQLVAEAISVDTTLVLVGILGFVACFAFSTGPIMWVLFAELFPNYVRAAAISFVGLVNSGVSFLVQVLFPWELATFGSSLTFLIYGLVAIAGLAMLVRIMPETRGKSLEELEQTLAARSGT